MQLRIQSWHGDQELIRLRKKMSSFGLCTAGQDNGLIYNADTKLAYSVILGCVGGDLHAEKFHVRYIAMWSASCSGSIKDILAAAETFQLGDMEHPANP